MRRLAVSLVALALVFGLSTAAFAEDERVTPRFGVGVGLGLDLGSILTTGTGFSGTISAPMVVAPFLKVEPEISLWHFGSTSKEGDYTSSTSITDFGFGVGTYFLIPIEELELSVGLKLGINYLGMTDTEEDEIQGKTVTEEDSDKFLSLDIGPAASLEYYFGEHFSLGADIYLSFAFKVWDDAEEEEYDTSWWTFSTLTMVTGRWYF